MNAREALHQRPDIPDEEVDDIVAIAARLKDEAQAEASGATAAEVAEVALELDIEPEYVEAALEQWRADKEAAREADAAAEYKEEATRKRQKGAFWGAVASVVLLVMVVVGLTTLGASRVNGAHHQVVVTQAQLSVVLDRQAALAPQLVAMGGGDPATLVELASDVASASDMEFRLQKSKELGLEMAKELMVPPGTMTEADAQIRLNLQHEVTGTQNRITTETRRYRAAKAAHLKAADSLTGRLATGYGLADTPE